MTAEHSASALPQGAVRRVPGSQARSSLIARLAHAPTVWLTLLVGLSTLARVSIGLGVSSPWILPDEILYADLARSIADGAPPGVRGVTVLGWGVVYPILVAPAWAVFGDPVWAYHAALAVNALVMSSAAIPAYLLARLFLPWRSSVVVAAMTVLVPSMAYTGVVMTENAFYPLFLWTVLLIARAVRHPTVAAQLLVLAGVAVLAATRVQGVALVGAYLASVALYAFVGPRAERGAYLRRFVPTLAALSVVSLPAVAALAALGGGSLGNRSGTFDGLRLLEVPEWLAYLAGGLVLYVALIPAAATVMVWSGGVRRRASERERLFAAVALPVVASLLLTVSFVSASIDVDGTENLNERYVFYVVPLLFLGLALWIHQGLPRARPSAWVAVGACSLLALVVPIERLEYNAGFQSLALLPWLELADTRIALLVALGGFVAIAGALWLTCRPDRVARLWLVVGAWMAFVGVMAVSDNANLASFHARAFDARPATWVDRAVPAGEDVTVLWHQRSGRAEVEGAYYWLLVTEMFNESIGDVYRIGPPTHYDNVMPTVPVRVRPDADLELGNGAKLEARYVLVTCRVPVEGRVVATSPYGALQLVETTSPLRLSSRGRCPSSSGS